MSHVTVSGDGEPREMVSHITVSGDGGSREMVSHVTVSGAWEGESVACNGFWDVEDEGTRCHM